MIERIRNWYKSISLKKQALAEILLLFFYFGVAHFVFDFFLLNDKENAVIHKIVNATWFAFFITIGFSWNKIKVLLKKNKKINEQ